MEQINYSDFILDNRTYWDTISQLDTLKSKEYFDEDNIQLSRINKLLPSQTVITNDSCSICLDKFSKTDLIRILNCSHKYHINCIDTWLTLYNLNCPYCRKSIIDVI
jgi:hypothetical protein